MVSSTASTRQPPAGGPDATVDLGELLTQLGQGDREAFVRYFRRFRAPVHHFAWRLLRDERAAVDATTETLVGVFRRAILDDGAGDLEVLTYEQAFEACEARAGSAGDGAVPHSPPAGATEARRRRRGPAGATQQRFDAALESLELRPRAALLLHDLAGLGAARSGAVLGVDAAAAAALLFKAREEFRTALRGRASYTAAESCHQAEEAAAAAVGLGMSPDERSRLQRHAGYCRPCRKVMRDWTGAGAGLAVALARPPLPQALAATPVFGDVVGPAAAPVHRRALAAAAGALRARTTAWVVALACVAIATGVVVHGLGVQPLVLMQSVGPAIRLIVAPPVGEEAAAAPSHHLSTAAAAGTVGISATSALSRPAATQSSTPTGSSGAESSGASPSPSGQVDGDRQVAQSSADAGSGQGDGTTARDERAAARGTKAAAKAAKAQAKAGRDKGRARATKANGHTHASKANGHAHATKAGGHTHAAKANGRTHASKASGHSHAGKANGHSHAGKANGHSHAGKANGHSHAGKANGHSHAGKAKDHSSHGSKKNG